MDIDRVAASAGLLTAAGLHAAWSAGLAWPFRDRAALADAVVGAAEVPGPAACLAVSGGLGLAGQTRLVSPVSVSARFMRLDRRVYSPLCLTLAGLAALSARPSRRRA
ncbi:MAG: hypothetical protein ACRDPO_17710 [Streptosporangiaceae bacterium]